jgi:hypothetical protein
MPGQSYDRFLDATVPLHDGAAACSIVIAPSANGAADYVAQNTGNVDMKSCDFVLYAYDGAGKQLARIEVDPFADTKKRDVLRPAEAIRGLVGGARADGLERRIGVTWEAVVTKVVFADGATWSEPSRAPARKSEQTMP